MSLVVWIAKYALVLMSRFQVVHDRNKGQFQVSLTGGRMAVLEYEEEQPRDGAKEGSRVLDLYHTEVPPEFGGQGIAAALADAAFAHCSDNGYKMRLTCEYLHRYLQNNKGLPDSWRNLVVSEDP